MSVQFDAFLGSATALSSFTLTDTRVYLNVGASKNSAEVQALYSWTSIEQDPCDLLKYQNFLFINISVKHWLPCVKESLLFPLQALRISHVPRP